jgi:hypothetical protein
MFLLDTDHIGILQWQTQETGEFQGVPAAVNGMLL